MANIEKISVSGTSYDVRDANAAHALIDIAAAGDNIEFARDIQDNYSVQGTGVTVSSAGVASGFTTSDYIYKDGVWNSICIADNFEFQTKFKVNSLKDNDYIASIIYANYTGKPRFGLKVDASGRLQVMMGGNDPAVISASGLIGTGVDYWAKVVYQKGSSVALSISTDGETFTSVGTSSSTYDLSSSTSTYPFILGAWIIYSGTSQAFTGSIDLTETYFKDGNGNTLWAPVGLQSDKIIINASVDQTYSSSSTNAQSGVAINNAKFVRNLATGTNALSIGGGYASSQNWAVNIGSASQATCASGIAIGSGAKALTTSYSTAVGVDASATKGVAIGAYSVASNNAIALGNGTSSSLTTSASGLNAIALGQQAVASGSQSIMIGTGESSAAFSIQLGYGMNSTANTFSVGLSASNNYRLLNSDGTIPSDRLSSSGSTGQVLTKTATGQEWATPSSGGTSKEVYTCPALTTDGTSCSWTVNHTLGTDELIAQVYYQYSEDAWKKVEADIEFLGNTSEFYIDLISDTDIPAGTYKVVIIG